MIRDLDIEAMLDIDLDPDALSSAVDAATDAYVAGFEEEQQLEYGIKAYLWHKAEDAKAEDAKARGRAVYEYMVRIT